MLLPLLIGCAAPIEAPTELSDLSGWLYEACGGDEETLAVGMENLRVLLTDPPEDGYLLDPLSADNIADITHPDRDPSAALGLAISTQSPFSPTAHVALMELTDLTPISPSAETYDRSFLSDPGCFPDGCDELITTSDIYRSNLLLSMGFTIDKDYRQVTLQDGRVAFIARGWMAQSAHGEDGSNHLWQSYELDIWLPTDSGSLRMLAMWSEGEYTGVGEDLAVSMLRMGMQDALTAQDAYLAGE